MTCAWTHTNSNVNTPEIQLIFDSTSKTTNNQQQTEKNQQREDQKRKAWPALGEVKTGEVVEGGPEEEAAGGGPEEEAASWVEAAFLNNENDFSQITYQKQHVYVQSYM